MIAEQTPIEKEVRNLLKKEGVKLFESPLQEVKKEELKIFIKDILESEVDKKYYLSEKLQERFKKYLEDKNKKVGEKDPAILDLYNHKVKDDGTCITLSDPCHNNLRLIEGETKIVAMRSYPRTGTKEIDGERTQNFEPQLEQVSNTLSSVQKDNLVYDRKGFDSRDKFRESELSPTLSTKMGTGGNNVPMIIGYTNPNEPHQSGIVLNKEGISNSLYAQQYKSPVKIIQGQLRRLTPKECFRLQGFLNDEINLDGISDTQKYKLAGNGQSVNVVAKIFERMFN